MFLKMHGGMSLAAFALLGLASLPVTAQQADNTAVNRADRSSDSVTADQQKMGGSDTQITAKIRRALMADKTLSTYAHNVKIITRNGSVTLKGPVRSEAEKSSIESKATEIAGQGNVVDQLAVAPPKDSN